MIVKKYNVISCRMTYLTSKSSKFCFDQPNSYQNPMLIAYSYDSLKVKKIIKQNINTNVRV